MLVLLVLVGFVGFLLALIEYTSRSFKLELFGLKAGSSVVVVIAHPDDEVMFFGPLINRLVSSAVDVHLLCLSNGDYYGGGKVREKELAQSASVLQLNSVQLCDLDDGAHWDLQAVAEAIGQAVCGRRADAVFTFDAYGVSGHPNHGACFEALRGLVGQPGCAAEAFALTSLPRPRKYLGLADVLLSGRDRLALGQGLAGAWRTLRAMRCHRSQLLWFRYLYFCFSRYLFLNSFSAVAPINRPS